MRPAARAVFLLLATAALLPPDGGAAQASEGVGSDARIEGVVRSRPEDGGAPLPHAIVEVVGTGKAVLADGAGRYLLADVEGPEVRLRASSLGFAPAEVEAVLPRSGTLTVDLELTRRPVALAGLVVRGDPLEIPGAAPRETPDREAARGLVRLKALEASTGMVESGLAGFARAPGGGEAPDPADALLMRGSTADMKLVLLDGAPVYAPFHLGGLLQGFDPDLLGAAEHWIGGAPARYDGGLSYILDLRTRHPRRDGIHAAGALDLMSARATVESGIGEHAGVLASSRALHGLGSRLYGASGAPYGYLDGLLRVEADAGASDLRLTAFGNRESVRLDVPAGFGPEGDRRGGRDAAWGNAALSGAWNAPLGDGRLEVGAAVSRYDAELPLQAGAEGEQGDEPPPTVLVEGRTDRARVTVEATRPGDAGPLRLGLSLDRTAVGYDRTGPEGTGGPARIDGSGTVLGAYLDGIHRLVDEVDLRYGARLDRFTSESGGLSTPTAWRGALRLALLWSPGPDALLTVAGGRYHQLARRGDTDVALAGGDPVHVGTDGLAGSAAGGRDLFSVARADHLVASLEQRLGDRVRLTTEGFFKRFEDVAGLGTGALNASGVDLRVARQGETTTAWLGYSLSWFWEPDGSGGPSTGGDRDFTGRHLLTAGLNTPIRGPVGVDLRVSYGDGLPLTSIPFSPQTDQAEQDPVTDPLTGSVRGASTADGFLRVDAELYGEWDASFGGREGRIRPYLKVLNALDRRDALFFYFQPWREDGLQPLAELSLIPVAGLEWRF